MPGSHPAASPNQEEGMNVLKITGADGSGKTTLARSFIADEIKQGRSVMVVLPVHLMVAPYDKVLFAAHIPQRSDKTPMGVRCTSVNTMLRNGANSYDSFVLEDGVHGMILEHKDRDAIITILNKARMVVSVVKEFKAPLW